MQKIPNYQQQVSIDQYIVQNLMKDETLQQSEQVSDQQSKESFDDQSLVQLHKIYGNKWKQISTHFINRNDSFIKNHFYSLLRRSLRRLNAYTKRRNKQENTKNKVLKLNFVFKLTNLAESERDGICHNRYYTRLLYQFLELRNKVIQMNKIQDSLGPTLQKNSSSSQLKVFIPQEEVENLINCLKQIEHFFLENNLNKKGKSKKKCPKKLLLKKDILIKQNSKNDSLSESTKYLVEQKKQKKLLSPTTTKFSFNAEEARLRNFDFQQQSSHYKGISGFSFQTCFDPILFK